MFSEPIFLPKDYPDFEEFGDAPCSQGDPDAFFPEDRPDGNMQHNRIAYPMERYAKTSCFGCPYRFRCLEYAMKNEDLIGIWGGTTEAERRKMRRGERVRLGIPGIKHI
jgi:hypothetical protein